MKNNDEGRVGRYERSSVDSCTSRKAYTKQCRVEFPRSRQQWTTIGLELSHRQLMSGDLALAQQCIVRGVEGRNNGQVLCCLCMLGGGFGFMCLGGAARSDSKRRGQECRGNEGPATNLSVHQDVSI